MIAHLQSAATQIRHAVRTATEGLVGREQLAELIVLAAVVLSYLDAVRQREGAANIKVLEAFLSSVHFQPGPDDNYYARVLA
ncbi:hypothetical protein [Pseudomonas gelidaquae]|uniref:hypothetical protein n=1 Tax=Pseudomonas sp. IB20 TaxID=1702250 RepID=UPI002113C7BD|nr:hypothetical protein [Pseudomonas sp. IB20]